MNRTLLAMISGVALGVAGCSGSSSSSPVPQPVEESPPTPTSPGPVAAAHLSPAGPSKAAEPKVEKGTPEDRQLLAEVSARLLDVCPKVTDQPWPPEFAIDGDDVRASAGLRTVEKKRVPVITVTADLMGKVVEKDRNRLALILGHELGHHLARHLLNERSTTGFLDNALSRADEFEADRIGAELMLKAQFSLKKGLIAFDRLQDQGFDSWTFKALGDKHPKWDDRRAALDKERAKLWLAMAEFTNGVEWLAVENYPAATACFVSVLLEFPDSVESLANLGYAKLMHYCDKLDDKDEIHFQNGQIVTAGFYKREKSIVRGEDVELWQNAIEALERADKLKPNQATVLVHLGVARLVTPRSIGMDVDKANLYLRLAKMAADDDSNLHDIAVANLAVAANAEGKPEEALALLDPKKFKPANRDVVAAANYTRAIALADSKKDAEKLEALKLFEDYLNSASHLSRWWGAAYREYETLAKTLEKAPKARGEFTRGVRSHLRMATGVTLRNGKPISIGDTAKQLLDAAGPGRTTQAVPSTTTQRIRYESEGLEFLVVDDKVVAIAIVGPEAKPLEFRGAGVSTNDAGQLRIGMSETALVALLGETVRKPEILVPNVRYLHYREQGLAVRVAAGKVVEIVVVQLPAE